MTASLIVFQALQGTRELPDALLYTQAPTRGQANDLWISLSISSGSAQEVQH